MKPELITGYDTEENINAQRKDFDNLPLIITAQISENPEDFEGHFGILPINTLISLVKQQISHDIRMEICVTIDKSIAPSKTVKIDMETGNVSLVIEEKEEQIGKIQFPPSAFERERDLNESIIDHLNKQSIPEEIVFNPDASEALPHSDPFITIEEAAMYTEIDADPLFREKIISITTMPEDSPFHGPEVQGEKEDIGFLCEFAAQTGALFLNDPDNIVTLKSLKYTPLSEIDVEPGMTIECYSLYTPTKEPGNKRAKTCGFAIASIIGEEMHLLAHVQITGTSIPKRIFLDWN